MTNDTYLLALAGLLHDIGKFAVRANSRGTRIWDADAKRDLGYYHALLTADFVDKYVPEAWRAEVKRWAGNHHRPQSVRDNVVRLADHLSAGERADETDDTNARVKHPARLLSVFCSLSSEGKKPPKELFLPLKSLAIAEDTVFPVGLNDVKGEDSWHQYEILWNEFEQASAKLRDAHEPTGDLQTYLEGMQMLLQRYTWAMPSAYYKNKPDVSLYDHSRMTGALAAAMADWDEARVNSLGRATLETDTTPIALLVGGDLSGIQDFIYTITSRGATSALRGRSFYLQLLTEAIMRFVLRELKLPITNVVYSGGGKFFLLARLDSGDSTAKLVDIQKRIAGIMRREHLGDIFVSLESVTLRARDFYLGRISQKWSDLVESQQRLKLRRFSELDDLHSLFEPSGAGGDAPQCIVCGNEDDSITQSESEPKKCRQCAAFEELGDELRKASFLSLEEIEPNSSKRARAAWDEVLAEFGLQATLAETLRDVPSPRGARRVLLALSDENMSELRPMTNTSVGRRVLTNVTPILRKEERAELRDAGVQQLPAPGSVKPFDAMEAQANGLKRLGVLRMDVDNLGKLFANERRADGQPGSFGLGDAATLSRVATLSFAIGFFFEGWVATLAKRMNDADPDGERLYSIYSGGDDLFFIGAWDVVVELAQRISKDFSRYTAEHAGMHASAGIALIGGKYPLYRAASDSEDAEARAKRIKNAICFLDEVMTWDKFAQASSKADKLAEWCEKQHVSRSLLQTLQQLHLVQSREIERRTKAKQPKRQYTRATWLAAYQLTRVAEARDKVALGDELTRLRDELIQPDAPIREVAFAARWAQLKIR